MSFGMFTMSIFWRVARWIGLFDIKCRRRAAEPTAEHAFRTIDAAINISGHKDLLGTDLCSNEQLKLT